MYSSSNTSVLLVIGVLISARKRSSSSCAAPILVPGKNLVTVAKPPASVAARLGFGTNKRLSPVRRSAVWPVTPCPRTAQRVSASAARVVGSSIWRAIAISASVSVAPGTADAGGEGGGGGGAIARRHHALSLPYIRPRVPST